jgi:opacity protein-like surface antigen
VGFGASPSVSASGEPFGLSSEVEDPFGFSPAWFNKDFDTFFTAGGGVGYRWNPYFRTDLTIDYHSSGDADIKGSRVFQVTEGPDSWSRVTVNDRTSLNSAVFLFNGYVDFTPWRGITPYVGAGVGFAINSIDRRHDSTLQACDDEACADPGVGAETHAQRNTNDVTFAAALMAGITYEITPITSLDINYRFLHIGGSDLSLGINGAPTKVSIGDFNEHQIRAGLRFNVF